MKKTIKCILSVFVLVVFSFSSVLSASGASTYKTWLQSDSRWGSKKLGTSSYTMSGFGCAVTSVAMLMVHSGSMSESSFNPGTLCDYLNKNGGLNSDGDIIWGSVSGMSSTFSFQKSVSFSSKTESAITSSITSYINQGYYIVLSVNNDAHWVAVDTVSSGSVLMMDPAQNSVTKLFSKYSASKITQARLFKGKNAPTKISSSGSSDPSTTTTYYTGHYKTTDDLNLRSSYSTSSSVLLTIPSGKTVVVTRVYNNEWGQVEYNNKSGWISLKYTTYTESSYSYKTGIYKCNVSSGVNMRSGIGTDKSVVCLIPYNAEVTVSSVSKNWGKSTYGSKSGYICMEYLTYVKAATTTAATTKATTTTTKATTTTATATTTSSSSTTASQTNSTTVTTTAETTTTVSSGTLSMVKGDMNNDGKCTKDDIVLMNRYFASPYKLSMYQEYIMDTNEDSLINIMDVVYMMKKLKL